LVTVIDAVPLAFKSADATAIVSCDEPPSAACLAAPFQETVELERKPEPVIVRVKPPVPAAALVGEMDWIAGAGFCVGGGGGVVLPPPQEQSSPPATIHAAESTNLQGGFIRRSFW